LNKNVSPRKIRLTRAAEPESLLAIPEVIGSTCQGHPGVSESTCYDLKLAVEEACMNIITHGYAGMDPGSIIVDLELGPEQIVVAITDFGRAFEPAEAPAPDIEASLEDRPAGGFGLFFIYQTMDQVDYQVGEDGNRLILVKKLKSTGTS
jgi:serine/threonine-protein kinase RsbW